MIHPNSTIPVVTAPRHGGHAPKVEVQCGRPLDAFDTVARMDSILASLSGDPRIDLVPPAANLSVSEAIGRVHSAELITFLAQAWESAPHPADDLDLLFADTFFHSGLRAPSVDAGQKPESAGAFGRYCFDTITGIGPATFDAATASVASSLTASGLVARGDALAVALCRPPGHHVTADVFGGGCYLNNAAISAQWLLDQGAARVAIVDVDFHHGNGTQGIFYERGDVFYTSLHGHPHRSYPYFTGYADETGAGAGRGTTLNLPFDAEIEGPAYLALLDRALEAAATYRPEFIVVSLGFDTFHADPAGDAALRTSDYFGIGKALGKLDMPIVAVLEGGYSVPDLGANVAAWVAGASGKDEQ